MPYLLLAIGALMSVAGAYSIISGSLIVQVEAGWTSVIAGATLFAGGVLTMALGLVLRVLLELRKSLVSGAVMVPAIAPALATDDVPPAETIPVAALPAETLSTETLSVDAPPPIVFRPVVPTAPPQPALLQEDVSGSPGRGLPAALKLPLRLEPRLDNWRKPKRQPADKDVVPKDVAPHQDPLPTLVATPQGPETAPADPIADDFVRDDEVAPIDDDYKLETPSTPEHDLGPGLPDIPPPAPKVPAPRLPASPQLEDDWLDRAFAEFDDDLPKNGPATSPGADTLVKTATQPQSKTFAPDPAPKPVHPEADPYFEQDLDLEPAAVADAAPATAHDPEQTTVSAPPAGAAAAVIGRYESDGTTYIMYADGSIEAQSESGVYRFGSMAELKAFIEN